MGIRRRWTWVALAGWAALTPIGSGRAEETEVLRIATEWRDQASFVADRADPGDRLAAGGVTTLVLETTPPPGVRRVPEGSLRWYGRLSQGGQPVRFAFARAAGERGVLAFEEAGDGGLGGPEREQTAQGAPQRAQGQPVVRWLFSDLSVGKARLDVSVQVRDPEWQAVRVADPPVPLTLSTTAPAGARLLAPPPGPVRYAELEVGGQRGVVAFVRSGTDRLHVLFDRNANGVLGDQGEQLPVPLAGQEGSATYWQAEDVPVGSQRVTLALQEVAGAATASIRPAGARRGTAKIGGRPFALHVLDQDLDGAWDSKGDLWWFGPVPYLTQVKRLGPDAMVFAEDPIFLEGQAWRLVSVDCNGHAVLMRDPAAPSVDEVFHARAERVNRERWWPEFEAEAGEFRREQGIDAQRPRARAPVPWLHDVDLRAALAQAQRENKPVLVDFEADWCSWCKRFDFYVYPDAEVAELLRRFVRVKINKEFHFAGDFDRLGGKGLPFLVFLDPEGRPLRLSLPDEHGQAQICSGPPGFEGPARFAKTLRAAWAAWETR